MTTLNRSLVATKYINEEVAAGLDITDTEECADVMIKFVRQAGTPGVGASFSVRIEQNSYDPNPPPSTPISFDIVYDGTTWLANFGSDGGFNSFNTPSIPIPPNSKFNILDGSGGTIKAYVLGTKFRNFSN